MTIKAIISFIKSVRFSGITLNLGIIGINFSGCSSKANSKYRWKVNV